MKLSEGFQFSQSSLQDFFDCRRRFQLRYILGVAWPAIQSEPVLENEKYLRKGETFHHLVHQHLLGVSEKRLSASIHDSELEVWWHNYLRWAKGEPQGGYPEVNLTAPLGEFRLVAKYDLVMFLDKRLLIWDWKTARRCPRKAWLAERLQTRVYPYLIVRAGSLFNSGEQVRPEQVEMVYWFAGFPNQPERIPYNAEKYREDDEYLLGMVTEIQRLGEAEFLKTAQIKRCSYCVYRSLCERGVRAGSLDELEESQAVTEVEALASFEQIVEIEF